MTSQNKHIIWILEMDCQFISIYGNFVTSQTASFSRADIKVTVEIWQIFRTPTNISSVVFNCDFAAIHFSLDHMIFQIKSWHFSSKISFHVQISASIYLTSNYGRNMNLMTIIYRNYSESVHK